MADKKASLDGTKRPVIGENTVVYPDLRHLSKEHTDVSSVCNGLTNEMMMIAYSRVLITIYIS